MYWRIGHSILARQEAEGWGTRVIDRLSADLRQAFPKMRGLSQRNLSTCVRSPRPGQTRSRNSLLRDCRGGQVTVLLDKLDDPGGGSADLTCTVTY